MSFEQSILEEFSLEASELLDSAEESLLKIESEKDLQVIYNSVFRAFHSLKGSAGMIGFDDLQRHLHLLEDYLQKSQTNFDHFKASADYYLKGIDAARKILNGEVVQFKYEVYGDKDKKSSSVEAPNAFSVKVLVLLTQENPTLLKKILNYKEDLSFEVETVIYKDGIDLKKDFSFLVTDLTPDKIKNTLPASKSSVPKLFVSDQLHILTELKNAYFLKANDENERFYYFLKLLISEFKQQETYLKAKGLMLYMYSDMEDFLISKNKTDIQKTISSEIKMFIKNYMS